MPRITQLAFALALICFPALLVSAQTPRVSTVNITAESDKLHISTQGDVSEMRIEVSDEQGDVVFQSGAITGKTLDWNMRAAQGERVAPGTYMVTVTFRNAAGKLRKRVEQVTIAEDEKASPRNTAAPNAVQATITGSGTTNRIAKFTGAATIGDSVIVESAGRIGIGTTGPVSTLTVLGTLVNNAAITSTNNATRGVGVKGSSSDSLGIGVWGRHTATTGTTPGVRGETLSTADEAVGVQGVVNTTNPGYQAAAVRGINKGTGSNAVTSYGVWGEHAGVGNGVYGSAPNGTGVSGNGGLVGVSAFSPSGYGVYASSNSGLALSGTSISGQGVGGASTSFIGVYGVSDSNHGVHGKSTSSNGIHGESTSGYAGYFEGKAKVTGTLEVGSCTGCARVQSDQNIKTNFAAISPRFILDRLAALNIKGWNYKSDERTVRHIGPMAQDFRSAFNLGVDDKHIDMIDANGVTMAAIQGLYQMVQEKDKQIEQLQSRVVRLEHTLKKEKVKIKKVKVRRRTTLN